MKTSLRLSAVVAGAALFVAAPGPGPAARSTGTVSPKVSSAFGTPTLDGVLASGEWSGAVRVDSAAKQPSGASVPVSLSVMNDASNVYLAYQIGAVGSGWDGVAVDFDGDGDGAISEGDQTTVVNLWQGQARDYTDGYFTKKPPCPVGASCLGIADAETGGSTDGRAVSSASGGATSIEIALPLNDGDDAHDLNLGAGDLFAIADASTVTLCDGTGCSHTQVPATPLEVVVAPFVEPVIDSIEPARGPVGTTVTIEGDHFAGATGVTFGGRAAGFNLPVGARVILATVPAGAVTGPVVVTAPGGTATSRTAFTVVTVKPVIGAPSARPRTLVAGRAATVAFPLTRSDNGAKLVGASMTCDPLIDGRVVSHREALRARSATLRLTVPRTAAGKVLRVRLAVTYRGKTARRVAAFAINRGS